MRRTTAALEIPRCCCCLLLLLILWDGDGVAAEAAGEHHPALYTATLACAPCSREY